MFLKKIRYGLLDSKEIYFEIMILGAEENTTDVNYGEYNKCGWNVWSDQQFLPHSIYLMTSEKTNDLFSYKYKETFI